MCFSVDYSLFKALIFDNVSVEKKGFFNAKISNLNKDCKGSSIFMYLEKVRLLFKIK